MKIKEELKGFNINIDDIEPCDFEESIKDLCKNIALALDKQRYEIVLNKNIIDIKDTFTNFHSYMGLKVSFESFEKDIGFIVRPNFELSYDELQQENKQLKDNWNKLKELTINSLDFYKGTDCEYIKTQREFGIREAYRIILGKMQELEGSDSNE